MATGEHITVHQINVSDGGVPKRPVASATALTKGLDSDRQAHPKFHGGPTRAVCLLGLDVIERLREAGHPIEPGSTGENLTLAGVDWASVPLGTTFHLAGGVVLEALSFATPCANIRDSFRDGKIALVHADKHPGNARIYARVVREGLIEVGEAVRLERPHA